MAESVIFSSPVVLLLFGAAILLNIFGIKSRSYKAIVPLISAAICIAALIYAFFAGAETEELIVLLLAFTVTCLYPYVSGGGNQK